MQLSWLSLQKTHSFFFFFSFFFFGGSSTAPFVLGPLRFSSLSHLLLEKSVLSPKSGQQDAGRRRRGEEQGFAGEGRRGERQEAAPGPAQRPSEARARGRRRGRRPHRRGGGGGVQPERGGRREDRQAPAPLPALHPPLQAPRLPVQSGAPGLRRLRGPAALRAVQGVRGRRRLLRPLPRAGRRRLLHPDRVPQRRLHEARHLPRGRRAPDRVPARALPLHGAGLRLRRRAAGARRPPPHRPRGAGARRAVRQGQPAPPAGVGAAARAPRRRRQPRVPPHRGRARRRRDGRVRGVRQGERGHAAAVRVQDVGQPGGGELRQGGHGAGGHAHEEQLVARRGGRRGRADVPDGATNVPGAGSCVHGNGSPPAHPHRQALPLVRLFIGLIRSSTQGSSWLLSILELQLKLSTVFG